MAKALNLGVRVSTFIEGRFQLYLSGTGRTAALRDRARRALPSAIADGIDEVLPKPAYRDGLMIQSAYALLEPGIDLTKRHIGARSVSERLGKFFASRHISGVVSAYQNIAKNNVDLCRGNVRQFDDTLRWANGATRYEIHAVFAYVAASTAATARPIEPMPELENHRLNFKTVVGLLDELLDSPSGGAHDQFAVAAFLQALIDEMGQGGIGGLRIETKRLNASDASSGTAGDVQVKRGGKTEEAFEVSASDWREKVSQARALARSADLPRAHIIAMAAKQRFGEAPELDCPEDISVIDTRSFLHTLVASVHKPARAGALRRLYEHLDRNQPDSARVNAYVNLIRRRGLASQR